MIYFLTIVTLILWLFLLRFLEPSKKTLEIEIVKSFLPQTSCTDCGYDSCAPYAESLLNGEKINLCTMGGTKTLNSLRDFFSQTEEIGEISYSEKVEIIDEKCIGCTRCIKVCPVDAIVGAPKLMHSVIADICNACRLCLAVCPTECIKIIEKKPPPKPNSYLNCIRCARCNSAQNPNMDKLYYLVESGDGAGLAKLNLSLNENKEVLNRICPIEIPLYDYLTYGIYLAKDAEQQEALAKQSLRLQNQKIARQKNIKKVQKSILEKSKKENLIKTVNIYTPKKSENTQTLQNLQNSQSLQNQQSSQTEHMRKNLQTKEKYKNKLADLKNRVALSGKNPENPENIEKPKNRLALDVANFVYSENFVSSKKAEQKSHNSMHEKLANLKNKVANQQAFVKSAKKYDFNLTEKRKPNFVIAKKVALDNLNYANKVLHNLKKATDTKASRIREQKILIEEAKKQLAAIEKELMLEKS